MTFIDFQPKQERNEAYARLTPSYEFEVLFPSGYAPGDGRFDWVSLPFLGVKAAGRSVQSLFPLKSTLRRCRSTKWIAVEPNVREATILSKWAKHEGVELQLWLDESQSSVWLWYVMARAMGSGITAVHWLNGVSEWVEFADEEKREVA